MFYIQDYNNKVQINDDIKELAINCLMDPLDNIPSSVTGIFVNISFNILIKQHNLPDGCQLIVNNLIIDNIETFDKMSEFDYNSVSQIVIDGCELTKERLNILSKLTNIETISLRHCNIKSLPNGINSLMNLKAICLEHNQITSNHESLNILKRRGVSFYL